MGTTNSPDGLKQQLDVAADDSRIIAVVLRVNSGGGVATAGEEMSTYVKEFREDTGKPVVVSSASTNASAAYEISSQADYIFTAHTTAIGCNWYSDTGGRLFWFNDHARYLYGRYYFC